MTGVAGQGGKVKEVKDKIKAAKGDAAAETAAKAELDPGERCGQEERGRGRGCGDEDEEVLR